MSKHLKITLPVGAYVGDMCHLGNGEFAYDLFSPFPTRVLNSNGLIIQGLNIGVPWQKEILAEPVDAPEFVPSIEMSMVYPALNGEKITDENTLFEALGITDEQVAKYRKWADKRSADMKADYEVSKLLREIGAEHGDLVAAVQLLGKVRAFIEKHALGCPESLFQRDNPQIDALTVMGDLCEVAGWKQGEDADE